MRSICSQALCRARPLCITCMRRWSSSLTIRLTFSVRSMATPRGPRLSAMLAADELPLDEELPVDACQVGRRRRRAGRRMVLMLSMQSRSRRLDLGAVLVALARLVKGKSARLRARRMRLEMTMSDSGPVPRSHSPLVWVRSLSSTVVAFHLKGRAGSSMRRISSRSSEARSYFSSSMASFISRRSRINWVRCSLPLAALPGPLAHVLALAVDVEDQRLQLRLEGDVIVGQPSRPWLRNSKNVIPHTGQAC